MRRTSPKRWEFPAPLSLPRIPPYSTLPARRFSAEVLCRPAFRAPAPSRTSALLLYGRWATEPSLLLREAIRPSRHQVRWQGVLLPRPQPLLRPRSRMPPPAVVPLRQRLRPQLPHPLRLQLLLPRPPPLLHLRPIPRYHLLLRRLQLPLLLLRPHLRPHLRLRPPRLHLRSPLLLLRLPQRRLRALPRLRRSRICFPISCRPRSPMEQPRLRFPVRTTVRPPSSSRRSPLCLHRQLPFPVPPRAPFLPEAYPRPRHHPRPRQPPPRPRPTRTSFR